MPGGVSETSETIDVGDAGDTITAEPVTEDYPMPPPPQRTQTVPPAAMPDTESSQTRPAIAPVDVPVAFPSAESPASPPSTRKRSPLAVISIVLLILLLLIIGTVGILMANGRLPFFGATPSPTVAATATATSAPTATPANGLVIFTDPGNIFTIGYPRGWSQNTRTDPSGQQRLVFFSDNTSGATFNVGTYVGTDTPPRQVAETALAALAQKTPITNRSGPTTAFVAGQSWTQESGDVTVKVNGQPTAMHAMALATIHGQNTVYILEFAPVNSFATVEPTFQQMLQTFTFAS